MIQIIVLFFRIAVFSVSVLKDERIIIIAEQRPDCTEEEVNNPTPSCIYSNFSPFGSHAYNQYFNVHVYCVCQSFQWMSRVLQAVDSIHQVGVYCLALVPPNYLPKVSDHSYKLLSFISLLK